MSDKRKVSPERRKEIARAAAAKRWAKRAPRRGAFDLAEFCRLVALSGNLPAEYYQKPTGPIFGQEVLAVAAARAAHVIQLGREVGLQPAQALASISVKHGRP